MCMVSFITTPIGTGGPVPFTWPLLDPPNTALPIVIEKTVVQESYPWSRETFEEFKQVVAALKRLDEKLGLKDCEDESKAAWMKRVEDRLAKLEGAEPEKDDPWFGSHIRELVAAFRRRD